MRLITVFHVCMHQNVPTDVSVSANFSGGLGKEAEEKGGDSQEAEREGAIPS